MARKKEQDGVRKALYQSIRTEADIQLEAANSGDDAKIAAAQHMRQERKWKWDYLQTRDANFFNLDRDESVLAKQQAVNRWWREHGPFPAGKPTGKWAWYNNEQ